MLPRVISYYWTIFKQNPRAALSAKLVLAECWKLHSNTRTYYGTFELLYFPLALPFPTKRFFERRKLCRATSGTRCKKIVKGSNVPLENLISGTKELVSWSSSAWLFVAASCCIPCQWNSRIKTRKHTLLISTLLNSRKLFLSIWFIEKGINIFVSWKWKFSTVLTLNID